MENSFFGRAWLSAVPMRYSDVFTARLKAVPSRSVPPNLFRQLRHIALATVILLLLGSALSSFAATLSGTVTNGSTNKPSAGDEVILIKLAAGMDEIGHTKTDAHGKFTFTLDDDKAPHLVRAIHQGVTYHKPAPPGTNSVEVQVYDASPKVDGVNGVADLMYLQASKGQLGITRIFAVDNKSKPPRTQMNDANFEFYIPAGAEIDGASAQTAGGQGVNISPTPQAEKGRYAFVFPLRPGQTEFQVSYHITYPGKATVDPHLIYPLQHFVAIMPRSIGFTPAQSGIYEDKQPPDQTDAIAEVASNPQPGQKLSFEISGDGMLKDQNQDASNGSAGATAASTDTRPGGGLGPPSEAPDPLDRYRGYILGGFGLVLVAGAIYITNRSRSSHPAPLTAAAASGHSGVLLDALKEELFQLEIEHKEGQISDQEYTKAKSALDQTLSRAIKRNR
jgi:hypothetical protein